VNGIVAQPSISSIRTKGYLKIHLKRTTTDRLSLCNIWPGERWVLKKLAHLQDPNTTCKVCGIIAARPEDQEKNQTASA
jgi:hypothetical protein